jgi:hypothetical protein
MGGQPRPFHPVTPGFSSRSVGFSPDFYFFAEKIFDRTHIIFQETP